MSEEFNPKEWITTAEAAKTTGYSVQYVRRLIRQDRVKAQKWANVWMVDRSAIVEYKRQMESLGPEKHNPWRTRKRDKKKAD
jgi:excisionase family DNA binding protein